MRYKDVEEQAEYQKQNELLWGDKTWAMRDTDFVPRQQSASLLGYHCLCNGQLLYSMYALYSMWHTVFIGYWSTMSWRFLCLWKSTFVSIERAHIRRLKPTGSLHDLAVETYSYLSVTTKRANHSLSVCHSSADDEAALLFICVLIKSCRVTVEYKDCCGKLMNLEGLSGRMSFISSLMTQRVLHYCSNRDWPNLRLRIIWAWTEFRGVCIVCAAEMASWSVIRSDYALTWCPRNERSEEHTRISCPHQGCIS